MDESKVSILVVDDRPEKLLSIEAILEDLGLNIVRAYSGREALRQVLLQGFAVILLDVNMPDMDGFETAHFIRQRQSSSHVPIIFLTAMSDEMHVARGYSLGAVDYMLTPVVPQVLRSKVMVFVDLFRKSRQVELQADRLRQRAMQLHRLTSASLSINSAPSVNDIVRIAADTARDLIGAHQSIIFATPPRRSAQPVSYAAYSEKYATWRSVQPALSDCTILQSLVAAANKPVRMRQPELEAHAPIQAEGQSTPPLLGLLAVPLAASEERNMGLMFLSDKMSGEFNDDDQAVLIQLSQVAAVAIENVLFSEEREANRLKDEFLATLSHELRTPLSAISGWVQILKKNSNPDAVAHGVQVIERNVRAQTKLIEDLLDLSRVTSGKLRLNVRPTALATIAGAAVDALRPVVQEKGVTLTCEFDAADSIVFGDPDRLQQVFTNLLTNASKFTPSGGQIDVRLQRIGQSVRLSVADSGEGIDPEFLPHVFDRFRQADSTSTRRHGGLGIGLTIVRQIVALHHGAVSAQSEGKGRGATFAVTLPVARVGELDAGSQPARPKDRPSESLKDMRVLVVDDDADCREVVAEMLQAEGAEVTTAASAMDALRLVPTFDPRVIVTDLAMPQYDGFAFLRELRNLPADRGGLVPAIALTAYARPEDRAFAMEFGFQGYLAKPPDANALTAAIAEVTNAQDPDPEA